MQVLVKVYGQLSAVDHERYLRLDGLLRQAVCAGYCPELPVEDIVSREGLTLSVYYEGRAFPVDVLEEAFAGSGVSGALACIDLEEWIITRYVWEQGALRVTRRGLGDVLEHRAG